MKLYIAGPMRGIKEFNFPAFDAARDALKDEHEVLSPADFDRSRGLEPRELGETWDWGNTPSFFDLEAAMRHDMTCVFDCEGLVLLDGWQHSKGAMAELMLARCMRKKIFTLEEGKLQRRIFIEPRVKLI